MPSFAVQLPNLQALGPLVDIHVLVGTPVEQALQRAPSSVNVPCPQYVVRLLFPNNVIIEAFAIEAPMQGQQIQCLIGRDVLALGVLVYTGYMNLFSFSL